MMIMVPQAFGLLGFIAIVLLAAFLFRAIRALFFDVDHGANQPRRLAAGICPRAGCNAVNPPHARFCGRCGQGLE